MTAPKQYTCLYFAYEAFVLCRKMELRKRDLETKSPKKSWPHRVAKFRSKIYEDPEQHETMKEQDALRKRNKSIKDREMRENNPVLTEEYRAKQREKKRKYRNRLREKLKKQQSKEDIYLKNKAKEMQLRRKLKLKENDDRQA